MKATNRPGHPRQAAASGAATPDGPRPCRIARTGAARPERAREQIDGGAIGLHEARHSYCSMMLAAGVPVANVSRYARHSSVGFTLARYVHARTDQASDDAAIVDRYLAAAHG